MMISDRLFQRLVLEFILIALRRWGYSPDITSSAESNLMHRVQHILDEA